MSGVIASDRFHQLVALANEANAEAVADLWREFGFHFRAAAEVVDEILTLEELASRLKLSPWTIRRLIKRRVLAPLRTGRTLRFHWDTVKYRLGVCVPTNDESRRAGTPSSHPAIINH